MKQIVVSIEKYKEQKVYWQDTWVNTHLTGNK